MRALGVIAFLALAACAGSPQARGRPSDPERLYRGKCAACHRPYPPESRTRAQWEGAMSRMAARAHLRDEERALLLGWLREHAKDSAPAEGSKP